MQSMFDNECLNVLYNIFQGPNSPFLKVLTNVKILGTDYLFFRVNREVEFDLVTAQIKVKLSAKRP